MRILRWAAKAVIAAFILFWVVVLVGGMAGATTLSCAPVDQAVELLVNTYGEELVGEGEGPNGTRLMIFAHPDGDTWAVIGLLPDGNACFIASGTDWIAREPTPPGSET